MCPGIFDFTPPDPIADLPEDRLERAMALRNGLIALCERRDGMPAVVYRLLRREFMSDGDTSALVPQFVRTTQDTGAMWSFLKDYSPQWRPRQQFVREQFARLIDKLEGVDARLAETTDTQVAPVVESHSGKPMYNLFVTGDEEEWNGTSWTIDLSRCLKEYTHDNIKTMLGSLDQPSIDVLTRLPCIFAYEARHAQDPKFGYIKAIDVRQGRARIQYEIVPVSSFLSHADFEALSFELDIAGWEMNRTHWAVKQVDLASELAPKGIYLPGLTPSGAPLVDVSRHEFDVGVSFPGESRTLVKAVVSLLDRSLGANAVFYDEKYQSQLARPSLDTLLQDIYLNRCRLNVVFVGSQYQERTWCGVEFRAIRNIIAKRDHQRVMYIRTDDGEVDGVFPIDGYIDARAFSADRIASFVAERVHLLRQQVSAAR